VDTVIIADGGPGPYRLGRNFIDTSSIRIAITGQQLTNKNTPADSIPTPAYTFVDDINGILFSDPVANGARMHIHFYTIRTGLTKLYSLYEKHFAGAHDSLIMIRDSLKRQSANMFADDNLTLSGYKSINVSVGTQGSMNLEQALDISISGDIAPQTKLSGHLTDQGTNLEGTRELSEFDRIYVALDNPHYSCMVGDQYVTWPVLGGLLTGNKKIKGLEAGYTVTDGLNATVKAFGAVTNGNFTVQNMRGRNGLQGPYYLTGNGEKSFIIPSRGTLVVSVNGQKCEEGALADYVVDYELGTITFMPTRLIKEDDFIRAEYEYRLYDYQRTMMGASVSGATRDSSVVVEGGIWSEADNKDQPLEGAFTADNINRMAASGDSAPTLQSSGIAVDPREVARESELGPLYTKDTLGHWRFTQFNKDSAYNNQGFYSVWFQSRGMGKGDYAIDSAAMKAYPLLYATIYRYVGSNLGAYTDSTPASLPQSLVTGEIRARIRPRSWLSSTIDIAGMSNDKNLFSTLDDNDNNGAASDVSLLIGKQDTRKQSAWLSAHHQFISQNFTKEVMAQSEGYSRWDDTSAAIRTGNRQMREINAGYTILPGLSANVSYGQFLHNNELHTDRISGNAAWLFLKNQSLSLDESLFRHLLTDDNDRRDALHYNASLKPVDLNCSVSEEWRSYSQSGRGNMGLNASAFIKKLSLHESLSYLSERRSDAGQFSAIDTGRSVSWDQSFTKNILPSWKLDGSTRYLNTDIFGVSDQSTMLAQIQSDVTPPQTGFTSHQEYSVNIEKASTYQTIGVYAQPGQGNAVWSDELGQYVPKANGDYNLQQREVYDSSSSSRVRKTRLVANWTFSPVKKKLSGILADCSWYGTLVDEEHLPLDESYSAGSWVPGYMSLFSRDGIGDSSHLQMSDCSYRQTVDWTPDSLRGVHGVHGKAYVESGLKLKKNDHSEKSISWGAGFDRTFDPWFLSVESNILSIWWHGTSTQSLVDSSVLDDRSLLATQRFSPVHRLALTMKETVGFAGQTGASASSGWYSRVAPGIEWQMSDRGSAEASYTYSNVDVANIIDPRLAQGFTSGMSQTIEASAHIRFATHFNLDLSYHGELGKNYYNSKGLHVFSMQMKAYL